VERARHAIADTFPLTTGVCLRAAVTVPHG